MKTIHLIAAIALLTGAVHSAQGDLKAGAAVVDVTPMQFPVLVNGGMTARTTSDVVTRINARAIVVADENERIGIVVVDSCMMPRPLLDEAKTLAVQRTKLKHDHILISATHTHTAPSSMGALGTPAQEDYLPVLRAGIAEALEKAEANLEPAKVGWTVTNAAEFTALRRWIRRPDRLATDPFGNLTVRANMHSGRNWDDVTGESGPEDPDLSIIAFQSKDGRPIAALANFSMHYFSGQKPLAADYFGLFSEGLQEAVGHDDNDKPPFVAMMSHGCSGDIWRRDYKKRPEEQDPFGTIENYTKEMLKLVTTAWQDIRYESGGDVAMHESRLTLNYRVPDQQRLEWAQKIVEAMGDRPPKTQAEVYAAEQLILHERQSTEIVVQGLRIGSIGIATTPNETYALTGLKVKLQSPLSRTMVIELANGGDGYIPPPEQHVLGGYNTWAARSAGLEVQAEPKIAETAIQLLEQSASAPRRTYRQPLGPAAQAIAKLKPAAWWRLDEFSGCVAADSSGHNVNAAFEPAVAYFLEGPRSESFCSEDETNRCVHFAGNRLRTRLSTLGNQYSVSMWIWNGMPADARDTAGWMFSRGHNNGLAAASEHLGVGGNATNPGRLVYQFGPDGDTAALVGTTEIERWTWNHVLLTRDGSNVRVYLNGKAEPEISGSVAVSDISAAAEMFIGGRSDNAANWEGRLDEVAVFDRVLEPASAAVLAASN